MLFLACSDKIKVTLTPTKKILSIDTAIIINDENTQAIAEALAVKDVEYNSSYVDLKNHFSSMGFVIRVLSVREAFKIPKGVLAIEVTDSTVDNKSLQDSDKSINRGILLSISWEEKIEADLAKTNNHLENVSKCFEVENSPEAICKEIIADINTI